MGLLHQPVHWSSVRPGLPSSVAESGSSTKHTAYGEAKATRLSWHHPQRWGLHCTDHGNQFRRQFVRLERRAGNSALGGWRGTPVNVRSPTAIQNRYNEEPENFPCRFFEYENHVDFIFFDERSGNMCLRKFRFSICDVLGQPQLTVMPFQVPTFYIPLYFQFVRGDSPLAAGVRLLPFIVLMVFFGLLNGAMMSLFGYYMPWYLAGGIFTTLGGSLMRKLFT